jgi:hypothetical protein
VVRGGGQGFAAPIWMTFKQAQELDGHVRKGEKGSLVVYADRIRRTELDVDTGEEAEREIPFLKGYTVFCVDQIDGLPERYYAKAEARLDLASGGGAIAIDDLSDAAKNLTYNNMFIGHEGGSVGANDQFNTGVGIGALVALNNTFGTENTALGYNALNLNTSGDYNTAIGTGALRDNNSNGNTALGYWAGRFNTTGVDNTFLGYGAGNDTTTGSFNTFLGRDAGNNNKAKSQNTAVGRFAMFNADDTTTSSAGNNLVLRFRRLDQQLPPEKRGIFAFCGQDQRNRPA